MEEYKKSRVDVVIVGSGIAGIFAALNLPRDKSILIITKDQLENSDSFLAQGGICMLRDEEDYISYFNDTMRAGRYENNRQSVDVMIRTSQEIIEDLVYYGVEFEKGANGYIFTREGAHSRPRILYHKDITGKEITSKLLKQVSKLKNVCILENTKMVDIIEENNLCCGIVCKDESNKLLLIEADYTILATGGIGGLYKHSTNYNHLTGDAIAIALNHNIKLKDIDYIQIHPTTFYSNKPGRSFLISESVRGEGAILLDNKGRRFVDELLPRDVVAKAIFEKMKADNVPHVWLSLAPIEKNEIINHFPNIYKHCLNEGYDITKESIPIVPAQHYLMGGIDVDQFSKTTMARLYAVGETSCNGVHGANRLASNSLLESLVFAKRASIHITRRMNISNVNEGRIKNINIKELFEANISKYVDDRNLDESYKEIVLMEIERKGREREQYNNAAKC